MLTNAPWISLNPLNFVDAAAKGAGLGLQASQIATGANEAADRLRLSYAQLAAQQGMHSQSVAAQQANAAAALAEAKQRADEQEAYRRAGLTNTEQHQAAEEANAAGHLDVAKAHQGMLETNSANALKAGAAIKPFHTGSEIVGYDPKTGAVKVLHNSGTLRWSRADEMDYQSLRTRLNQNNAAIRNVKTDPKEIPGIKSDNDAILKEMLDLRSRNSPGAAMAPGGEVPDASESPFALGPETGTTSFNEPLGGNLGMTLPSDVGTNGVPTGKVGKYTFTVPQ